MQPDFNLDDVCETILAIPANIAVFKVESNDRFVIMGMSSSLETLYESPPGAGVGAEVDDFRFDIKTRRRLRDIYIKCRDSGSEAVMEEVLPKLDSSQVWTSRTVVPLFDVDGDVTALVSTVSDITELVMTRKTLVRTLSTTASGFVTICAWCRKIRENDQWTPLDKYIRDHSESDEVVCPDCQTKRRY
ncbi:MAG: PAS domain-containing protein [Pseudohongiellaceae bacterium]